jgi:hypothetical protein
MVPMQSRDARLLFALARRVQTLDPTARIDQDGALGE